MLRNMPRRSLAGLARLWFTFEEPVGRRTYLLHGMALMVVKYAGDALIVGLGTGRIWTPVDYLTFAASVMSRTLADAPAITLFLLALWALPFIWIGLSMSLRRALDAGRSAWLSLLFFVPYANYAFMLAMTALPSATRRRRAPPPRPHEAKLPSALLAIGAGAALGLAMIGLSVSMLATYGVGLFLGTPVVVGAITAFLFARRYPATVGETIEVAVMALLVTAGAVVLLAVEGVVCVLMALPLTLLLGIIGAVLGRVIATKAGGTPGHAGVAALAIPGLLAIDVGHDAAPVREVRSAIEVRAAPEVVWRHVVAFPPLPPPTWLPFRLGVAFPERARIDGEGVGAVRYCIFSTGSFVEPITRWEPGRRLSFDVIEEPAPLVEWSPYDGLAPPHLDGYFSSRRGEFRLIALPDGGTRLEGSTWYELRIFPAAYWSLVTDALVRRIHLRVLRHVQQLAERDGGLAPSRDPAARSAMGGRVTP